VIDIGSVNFEQLRIQIMDLMSNYEHTVNKIKNIISDYRKRAEETPLLFEELLNKSDSV